MKIIEATATDRGRWDAFVDKQNASFFHYFDWKRIYEARGDLYIPLILESDGGEILGIFPFVRRPMKLHVLLLSLPEGASGGCVLKRGMSEADADHATNMFLDYIDAHHANACSMFILRESLSPSADPETPPTPLLTRRGFRMKYNAESGLPCTFFLPMESPFEEKVERGLWSHNLRKLLNRARRSGASVEPDPEFRYFDDFMRMLESTFDKHGGRTPTAQAMAARLEVFREKTKLFVLKVDDTPAGAILCHYSPTTCYLSKMPSSPDGQRDHRTKLLYHAALQDACENGYRFAEFGTTSIPSLAYWKERFKATRVPMRQYERECSTVRVAIAKAPWIARRLKKEVSRVTERLKK